MLTPLAIFLTFSPKGVPFKIETTALPSGLSVRITNVTRRPIYVPHWLDDWNLELKFGARLSAPNRLAKIEGCIHYAGRMLCVDELRPGESIRYGLSYLPGDKMFNAWDRTPVAGQIQLIWSERVPRDDIAWRRPEAVFPKSLIFKVPLESRWVLAAARDARRVFFKNLKLKMGPDGRAIWPQKNAKPIDIDGLGG